MRGQTLEDGFDFRRLRFDLRKGSTRLPIRRKNCRGIPHSLQCFPPGCEQGIISRRIGSLKIAECFDCGFGFPAYPPTPFSKP